LHLHQCHCVITTLLKLSILTSSPVCFMFPKGRHWVNMRLGVDLPRDLLPTHRKCSGHAPSIPYIIRFGGLPLCSLWSSLPCSISRLYIECSDIVSPSSGRSEDMSRHPHNNFSVFQGSTNECLDAWICLINHILHCFSFMEFLLTENHAAYLAPERVEDATQ
jgi:hypothetical protein